MIFLIFIPCLYSTLFLKRIKEKKQINVINARWILLLKVIWQCINGGIQVLKNVKLINNQIQMENLKTKEKSHTNVTNVHIQALHIQIYENINEFIQVIFYLMKVWRKFWWHTNFLSSDKLQWNTYSPGFLLVIF